MKRYLWAILLPILALALLPAHGVENQAFLGIFAETAVTKMAGMPPMPELPAGVQIPNMPGMPAMPSFGRPERKLSVRLWSPGLAPKSATAVLAPPAGLKAGDKLNLALYRPEPGKVEDTGGAPGMPDFEKFTIKLYWGSSDTVKPGQPKVITFGDLTPEQKQAMRAEAAKMRQGSSYFYKPDWTTGYWPTQRQPGTIAPDASLVGKYDLTTTYTGNVSIEAPANVDFLAPIDLTSPDLAGQPSLAGALLFQWKPIPNLLGSIATIMGMEGRNTLVLWTSSEIPAEWAAGGYDYLQMAEVAAKVKSTEMMPGDRQEVHVPAGIFKNADMAMFRMTGYGPGAALAEGQPLPRIQTKTSLNVTLGGKMMGGMGMGR